MLDTIVDTLVMAPAGIIGQHVVKELHRCGKRSRIGVHETPADAAAEYSPQIVKLDYKDPHSMRGALQGMKKLFLCLPDGLDPDFSATTIVQQAIESEVEHIVKISSMGADLQPPIRGLRHKEEDDFIVKHAPSYLILRPNTFMQLYTTLLKRVVNISPFLGFIPLPAGDSKISLVDARDIAAVAATSLLKNEIEYDTLTLTGPEALSQKEVQEQFRRVLGKRVKYINAPPGLVHTYIQIFEGKVMADFSQDWFAAAREGQLERVTQDIETYTKQPPRNFRTFLQDHASSF